MTDEDITKPERIERSPPTLLEAAVAYARELVALDIHETTHNGGPWIDRVLAQVRAPPGAPWCAATLYDIFLRASRAVGVDCPCPRSAGALRMYAMADERFKIGAGVVSHDRSLLVPGMAFFEDHAGDPRDGQGAGHCGIVLGWTDGEGKIDLVRCISGNTNRAGSREGNAIVEQDRPLGRIFAFLDFGRG